MGEFKTMNPTKPKHLNKDIHQFRTENPNYEIFNICVASNSGWFGVIQRLKNNMKN